MVTRTEVKQRDPLLTSFTDWRCETVTSMSGGEEGGVYVLVIETRTPRSSGVAGTHSRQKGKRH